MEAVKRTPTHAPATNPADYISLHQAVELLGGHVAYTTLWRYTRTGYRTPDGRTIRLRTDAIGRRILTTSAWLRDFIRDMNAGPAETPPATEPTYRSHTEATANLEAMGA